MEREYYDSVIFLANVYFPVARQILTCHESPPSSKSIDEIFPKVCSRLPEIDFEHLSGRPQQDRRCHQLSNNLVNFTCQILGYSKLQISLAKEKKMYLQ